MLKYSELVLKCAEHLHFPPASVRAMKKAQQRLNENHPIGLPPMVFKGVSGVFSLSDDFWQLFQRCPC